MTSVGGLPISQSLSSIGQSDSISSDIRANGHVQLKRHERERRDERATKQPSQDPSQAAPAVAGRFLLEYDVMLFRLRRVCQDGNDA